MTTIEKVTLSGDDQITVWLVKAKHEEQMEHWLWLGVAVLAASIIGVLTTVTITWAW